jgi:hypothetical protein
MAEARMALYRLHILKQPAVPNTSARLLSIWKNVRESILDMRSDHTIPIYNYSKYFNVIIDKEYWGNKDLMFPKDVLVFGKICHIFQTEIYAILQCTYENIRRAYRNKRILIFSDSQAALQTLSGP